MRGCSVLWSDEQFDAQENTETCSMGGSAHEIWNIEHEKNWHNFTVWQMVCTFGSENKTKHEGIYYRQKSLDVC